MFRWLFGKAPLSSPPVTAPEQMRPMYTTEAYRHSVFTPMVEFQSLPGVSVAETAPEWSGRSNAEMVVQRNPQTGNLETVLVMGTGVQI